LANLPISTIPNVNLDLDLRSDRGRISGYLGQANSYDADPPKKSSTQQNECDCPLVK